MTVQRDGRTDGRRARPKRPEFNEHGERLREKPGPKAGSEAAKHGGRAVINKYGREFFSRIGQMGGSTVMRRYGNDFYSDIGSRGGKVTKARHGAEYYARIGRKGGKAKRATTHKTRAEKGNKIDAA